MKITPLICEKWFGELSEDKKKDFFILTNCVFSTQIVKDGKFVNISMSENEIESKVQRESNIEIADKTLSVDVLKMGLRIIPITNDDSTMLKRTFLSILKEKIRYEKILYEEISKELGGGDKLTDEDIKEII
jgi:predicted type IV restriction endonuclease